MNIDIIYLCWCLGLFAISSYMDFGKFWEIWRIRCAMNYALSYLWIREPRLRWSVGTIPCSSARINSCSPVPIRPSSCEEFSSDWCLHLSTCHYLTVRISTELAYILKSCLPSCISLWLSIEVMLISVQTSSCFQIVRNGDTSAGLFKFMYLVLLIRGLFFHCFYRKNRRVRGEQRVKHQCEREVSVGCLPYASGQGSRAWVPWPGIKPATFWLRDDTPTNWATPARVGSLFCYYHKLWGTWTDVKSHEHDSRHPGRESNGF